ncbi:MAG: 3-methyl-2-oxobutanoate hydroxymethyltransferase [Alphaproteobacteria bacterium]|nr:3-methyl-2-oxobutanoate hydroxymethyltransferase [Alphaproteobacteria bacterium]
MMKKTIPDIMSQTLPIVCVTAYTTPIASLADKHCDLLLVGDSVSMVLYGEETTQKADMEMMLRHGKAVSKTAQNALVIVDMPYGSYEGDKLTALKNAQKLMDKTGCDGIKLEGGEAQADTIRFLVDNDIPVMAHIGLLPQSVSKTQDYKVQGREEISAIQLRKDAYAVQNAGAFSVVIEAVPEPLAAEITGFLDIPTIGIGASTVCKGQILVSEDLLGLSLGRSPKFVKKYADLNVNIERAFADYAHEVKNRQFPSDKNLYGTTNTHPLRKAS